MNPLVEAAAAWHTAGFCVLPASNTGNKAVGLSSWKHYQEQRPTPAEVISWAVASEGIGLLMGSVSGNAEMLEVEGKAADLITKLHDAIAAHDPSVAERLMETYAERTPSGGIHWVYRVDGSIAGNTKLASRPALTPDGKPARDTMIETRGEGGWVVVAPSGGKVHPTGASWVVLTGPPGQVVTFTAEERDLIHAVARTFDEIPEVVVEHREARTVVEGDLTPGQDYEARTTWGELLTADGWRLKGRDGDKELWTRPGKDPRHGASATVNYDGNDNLFVFSSSVGLEAEQSYTRFAYYTWMNHGGDFSAAARDLRGQGYGSQRPKTDVGALRSVAQDVLDLLPSGTPVTGVTVEETASPTTSAFDLTDHGNALRFAEVEYPRLRYAPDRDAWLRWTGGRWEVSASSSPAIQAMRALAEAMDHSEKALYAHKLRSLSASAISKAVGLAKTDPRIEVSIADFDSHPYELNTPDGIVDLLTGEVRPHEPRGLHTRMTAVGVDPSLPCPKWLRFLAYTFAGDPELIGFVQRMAGYSATGKVTHHALPFLFGSGANGKSVFMDVLLRVLGDYASSAPADFLLLGGREDESAVARLSGLRLVVCSEVGPDARFNEQKVKLLTGGDRLTARFLFQNHFTFEPTHHLWLMGNHLPRVSAGGDSFWRRVRMVPFTRTVPEAERIEGLADQLVREEGPAILAWIVEGARRQIGGLAEPAGVKAATKDYAEEEDHLGRFVDERIRFGGGDYVRLATQDVRHVYEQWCFAEGEKPIPANVFGREMKARGAGTAKSNGKRFYTNVTLMRADREDGTDLIPEQLRYQA